MSFSLHAKKELVKKSEGARHCLIAELAGIAAFNGRMADNAFVFHSENELVAEVIRILLAKIFNAGEEKIVENGSDLVIEDESLVNEILLTLKWKTVKDGKVKKIFSDSVLLKKECCKKAFLKGAFICAGSVNNPENAYHFEIICPDDESANDIKELFAFFGVEVKIVYRKKKYVVYLKDGEGITDALNIIGAFVAQMGFYDVMILKGMRNDVNRKVNCETANLNKTVSAAVKQIKDIEFIKENFGLDILNDGLKEMAHLRLEYPEASLKDLGEKFDPPLGRSGVNYRLKAIGRIAEEYGAKHA